MKEAAAPLWHPTELLKVLKLPTDYAAFPEVTGLSIDTRTLEPGELFIALKGHVQDGHAYVGRAFEKGASAALVDVRQLDALPRHLPRAKLLGVQDTQDALWAFGQAGRQRLQGKCVAITGSVGKTTLKESLGTLLSTHAKTHISPLSYNNHWGVPLSLGRMPRDTAYGVFELGMNRPGEIAKLTELTRPHVALITTIAPAHRAFFPSLEAIAQAKAEIFQGLVPGGIAILPHDHSLFRMLEAQARRFTDKIVTFGTHPDATVQCIGRSKEAGTLFTLRLPNQNIVEFPLELVGQIWTQNIGALAAVLVALDLEVQDFKAAFQALQPIKGRGSVHTLTLGNKTITLVDESYNANPASMKAALETFGAQHFGGGKKVVVLGDMAELGELERSYHLELQPLLNQGIDQVFTCGPLMRELFEILPNSQKGQWSQTAMALLEPLKETLEDGDALLLKGSNSMGLGDLVVRLRT